jgi:hypothetical protein
MTESGPRPKNLVSSHLVYSLGSTYVVWTLLSLYFVLVTKCVLGPYSFILHVCCLRCLIKLLRVGLPDTRIPVWRHAWRANGPRVTLAGMSVSHAHI